METVPTPPAATGPAPRRVRRWIGIILRLLFLAAILGYLLHANRDSVRTLLEQHPHWLFLAPAFAFFLAGLLIAIGRWHLLLRAAGVEVSPWWVFRCGLIGAFFNTFIPGGAGGDAVRVGLVCKDLPGRRSSAAVSVVVDRIVGLGGLFVLAAVMILLDWPAFAPPGKLFPMAAAVLAVSGALLAGLALLHAVRNDRRWPRFDQDRLSGKILGALAAYRHRVGRLLAALALSLVVHFSTCVSLYLCVLANPFEETLGFGTTLALGCVSNVVNALPLTAGGIGLGEGAFQELAALAGYSRGFTAFLLYRFVMIAANLLGGPFLLGRALALPAGGAARLRSDQEDQFRAKRDQVDQGNADPSMEKEPPPPLP